MKRVVVCLLLSAILLAACSNEKTEESLAPSEDAAVSTAFSEEAGAVSGTSSDAEESSMNENTKKVLDGSKLVVFGDSLTALGSWGETLADELNMYYFNGAMGGITSEEGIGRFGAFVANREPDFVTLCFGMNDLLMTAENTPKVSVGDFKRNMIKLVGMVREAGAEPVIVTTNPLVNEVFFASQGQNPDWYKSVGTPLEWLDLYNEAAREAAAETGCLLAYVRKACEGLDPKEIIEISELIRKIAKKHTVILSSHILAEVREVCDYIMIISGGKLVASDTTENLENMMSGKGQIEVEAKASRDEMDHIICRTGKIKEVKYRTSASGITTAQIIAKGGEDIREELFLAFSHADVPMLTLNQSKTTLEEIFLELTQGSGNRMIKEEK